MPRFSWLFWMFVGLALAAPIWLLWLSGYIGFLNAAAENAGVVALSLGLSAIGVTTGTRVYQSAATEANNVYALTTRLDAALSALGQGALRGGLAGAALVCAAVVIGRLYVFAAVFVIPFIVAFGAILSGSTALLFGTGIGQQPPTNNR